MKRAAQCYAQPFMHHEGWRFSGTLQPIKDSKIYNDDYFEVRQIMRVPDPTRLQPGDQVWQTPQIGYMLGHLEDRPGLYRSFRCYLLTDQVVWARSQTIIDPLTKIPRGSGIQPLGTIWVVSEIVARENRGGEINTREEVKRVLTNADVKLNDLINGEKVVKINEALGIKVLEVN